MPIYCKKPVYIEAKQWNGNNFNEIKEFVGDKLNYKIDRKIDAIEDISINTSKGNINVSIGDFIIKGIKKEFCTCKPDIFNMTYDIVE